MRREPVGIPLRSQLCIRHEVDFAVRLLEGLTDLALFDPSPPGQHVLDVVLLHEGILEPALGITPQAVTAERNLAYERDAQAALAAVDSGSAQIAFLLNACEVQQVMRVATTGHSDAPRTPALHSPLVVYTAHDVKADPASPSDESDTQESTNAAV